LFLLLLEVLIMTLQSTVVEVPVAVSPVGAAVTPEYLLQHQDTVFNIGADILAAEALLSKGEATREVADAALFRVVKGMSYVDYSFIRGFFKSGQVDKGESEQAAQKSFERAIKRIGSAFEFTPPKSEAKDAVRKSEAKVKAEAEMAKLDEFQIADQQTALIEKGDSKSLTKAAALQRELDKRNKGSLDAEKATRKAMADQAISRIKELAKAGTADADDLLNQVVLLLG
jgi:hypothetical protein